MLCFLAEFNEDPGDFELNLFTLQACKYDLKQFFYSLEGIEDLDKLWLQKHHPLHELKR